MEEVTASISRETENILSRLGDFPEASFLLDHEENIMQIFVTGGTGYIGKKVVQTLLKGGHRVIGLARSAEKEAQLNGLGATAIRGDVSDPSTFKSLAVECDTIIHMAIEFSQDGIAADKAMMETLLSAVKAGSGLHSVIYTSGIWVLGNTGDRPADEDASTEGAAQIVSWRTEHEKLVLDAATKQLATAIIRPGLVYGGKAGLIASYFEEAEKDRIVTYIGDGKNRWALVHRDDLAELYRLVAENRARGIFHGVDGVAAKVADIARAAGETAGKGGVVRSMPLEEARKQMGSFADALCLDQVIVARRSAELGWKPSHPPFLRSVQATYEEWKS